MTKIVTHPATPEYRSGWDRIFGKKAGRTGQQIIAEVFDRAFRIGAEGKIDAPGRPVHDISAEAPGRGVFGRDGI